MKMKEFGFEKDPLLQIYKQLNVLFQFRVKRADFNVSLCDNETDVSKMKEELLIIILFFQIIILR